MAAMSNVMEIIPFECCWGKEFSYKLKLAHEDEGCNYKVMLFRYTRWFKYDRD